MTLTVTPATTPTDTQIIVAFNDLADWLRGYGVTITRTPGIEDLFWPGPLGHYNTMTHQIYLAPYLSHAMALTVLTHEAAHAMHHRIDGDMAMRTPQKFDEMLAHGVTIALAYRLGTIRIPEVRESIARAKAAVVDMRPNPPDHMLARVEALVTDITDMLDRVLRGHIDRQEAA